jgi:hypothetical protein
MSTLPRNSFPVCVEYAASGASLVIIGKSLGHKDAASTLIYSRLNIDPVRDSMQTATRAMLTAGGLLPQGEFVGHESKTI